MTRQEIRLEALGEPLSHYTDAVRFGDLVFVSGLVGVDQNLNVVGGDDAARQTRQIFENLKLVLDQISATFADILKVTVYLTDIEDRKIINPVREEYFGSSRPASTLIQVSKLVLPGLKVEIEAVVGLTTKK